MNKSDFIIVYEEHRAGLQTKSGRVVLPCKYDNILDYDDDGYVRCIKDGFYSTIDLKGNVCISLKEKITHLGVFHKGTARARIDNKWGLVDVNGGHVTDFVYKHIDAHRNYGYSVVTSDGRYGILTENGLFKESEKNKKLCYQYIATYHNGVAPAVNKDGKCVFIDEDYNRINDVEYSSMDYVLRHGFYSVSNGPGAYGIADYRGVLIIDEWYDHPCMFEKGFAVCDILRHDDKGHVIKTSDGLSAHYYGVLDQEGRYIFPPVYTSIHWNNNKMKDCWFAEDDDWAYLLFPDGSRKVYAKRFISYDDASGFIPELSYDNNIKAGEDVLQYCPQHIGTYKIREFDQESFLTRLSSFLGKTSIYPLNYFYRDTDAEIDVKKLYKPGSFVCTDCKMLVTKKLLRPVHKIRFLIAAPKLITIYDLQNRNESGIKAYAIPAGTNFLVIDIQKCVNTTQVVLLHIPHGARVIAEKYKVKLSNFKPLDSNGIALKKSALYDIQKNFTKSVHGISLNASWCKEMYQPVGCNKDLQLNELELSNYYSDEHKDDTTRLIDDKDLKIISDDDSQWNVGKFMKCGTHKIKVFVGDITKRIAEVMINPVTDGISYVMNVTGNAEDCKNDVSISSLGKNTGSLLYTEAYGLPYKILNVRMSGKHKSSVSYSKKLNRCLDNALKEIEKNGVQKILIPALCSDNIAEVKTIVDVIVFHVVRGLYKGDVELFAKSQEDAQVYKSYLDTVNKTKVIT